MRALPRHWAVHREIVVLPEQGERDLALWGWSVDSPEEAQQHAHVRWQQAVARGVPSFDLEAAREYYPREHLPEQILEEMHDAQGTLVGAVTRNRYGAEVLNSDVLMICDVDFPAEVVRREAAGPPRRGLLSRLLRRPAPPAESDGFERGLPGEGVARQAYETVLERIGAFCAAHPELGVRAYRTLCGFRLLITGSGLLPGSEGARALMHELGTDPLYTTLCQVHETYRARLTPKPWRVGVRTPWPVRPWFAEQRWFRDWLGRYQEACAHVAVCRLVGTYGPGSSGAEAELVARHDAAVRATSGLRLA